MFIINFDIGSVLRAWLFTDCNYGWQKLKFKVQGYITCLFTCFLSYTEYKILLWCTRNYSSILSKYLLKMSDSTFYEIHKINQNIIVPFFQKSSTLNFDHGELYIFIPYWVILGSIKVVEHINEWWLRISSDKSCLGNLKILISVFLIQKNYYK